MVYNIIDKHGGTVEVSSKPGEGSSFIIYLPENEDSDGLAEISAEELNCPAGEGLVLVVDDEQLLLDISSDILKTCGYEVINFHNSDDAIEAYRRRWLEIRAVLMDMSMPGLAGKELFMKFREINPDVKVLLVSGFSRNRRIDEMLELGVKMFLQKPITYSKLAQAMHDVVYGSDGD